MACPIGGVTMPYVHVPGTHTAVIATGTVEVGYTDALVQSSTTFDARHLNIWEYADARVCASYHAGWASRAIPSMYWEPGVGCPVLGPMEPRGSSLGSDTSVVGWQTEKVPMWIILPPRYTVLVSQCTIKHPLLFTSQIAAASPSWIEACHSILDEDYWSRAVDPSFIDVDVTHAEAVIAVNSYSGTGGLNVTVVRRDNYVQPWCTPGMPGVTHVADVTWGVAGDSVTVECAGDPRFDQTAWSLWSPDPPNGVDLGYATVGNTLTQAAGVGFSTMTVEFGGSVLVPAPMVSQFGVPPLHATQRRGRTDAHATHAMGSITRQGKFFARGPL